LWNAGCLQEYTRNTYYWWKETTDGVMDKTGGRRPRDLFKALAVVVHPGDDPYESAGGGG
jgi:hypothetical protein